jgi:hypothetical protein
MAKTTTSWKRGQSGNPMGRPLGSRNKATVAAETLLDGEAEQLSRRAIDLAMAGDTTALRLCLERILPPRKDRPIHVDIPPIETSADALKALANLVGAVAVGQLTPTEAQAVASLLETHRRTFEVEELEHRIEALEAQQCAAR